MKKSLLVAMAILALTSITYAQMTGSVSGTVRDSLGNPIDEAMVRLSTGGGGHHHHGDMGDNYSAQTGPDGTYSIADVAPGTYIGVASKMMIGHDADSVVVIAGQNTVADFVLGMGMDGGGMHGDSLEIIEITGWAIVEVDSMHTHYFLDNNGDDIADYRLLFGPDWYDPGNGAQRPNDGDSIWVTGGIMGYSEPQSVVVYEINGLFWREPGMGHGGHGGDGGGCPDPDSLTLIETGGLTITQEMMGMTMYFLDENYDGTTEYHLNFGAPDYDPGNGAQRPDAGDTITIVGGLMEGCMMGDVIIVYEINGQFWRDPGDTTNLWPQLTSVYEQEPLPVNYILANSYPNPFNPTATISFTLANAGQVKVSVYDILGKEVAVLANGFYPAGESRVEFNSANYSSSSIYFYKVAAGPNAVTGKMTLLK